MVDCLCMLGVSVINEYGVVRLFRVVRGRAKVGPDFLEVAISDILLIISKCLVLGEEEIACAGRGEIDSAVTRVSVGASLAKKSCA